METEIVLYKKKKRKTKYTKTGKIRTLSRQELERKFWVVYSAYIRKRDGKCMMGQMWGGCWGFLQAGHVVSRRKKPTKYDEMNVFGQCQFHNNRHRFNEDPYKAWYVKTYGPDVYLELVKKSEQPAHVLSSNELLVLTETYKQKLLALG